MKARVHALVRAAVVATGFVVVSGCGGSSADPVPDRMQSDAGAEGSLPHGDDETGVTESDAEQGDAAVATDLAPPSSLTTGEGSESALASDDTSSPSVADAGVTVDTFATDTVDSTTLLDASVSEVPDPDAGATELEFSYTPFRALDAERLLYLQVFGGPASVQFLARSSNTYGADLNACVEAVIDDCVLFTCAYTFNAASFEAPGEVTAWMPNNEFVLMPPAPLNFPNPTSMPFDWPAFMRMGPGVTWRVEGNLAPTFMVELPLPELSTPNIAAPTSRTEDWSIAWSGGSDWVRFYVYSYEEPRALGCRFAAADQAGTVPGAALDFVTHGGSEPKRWFVANENYAWATSGAWTLAAGSTLLTAEDDLPALLPADAGAPP